MFSFPTAPIMILIGGFVGNKLAFNPEFSTLPIALVVVGTVSGIIPATFLMKKIGRKKGFVGASFYSSMASFLAVVAIYQGWFWLFLLSAFMLG